MKPLFHVPVVDSQYESKSSLIQVSVPVALKRALQHYCVEKGVSISKLIREFIARMIEESKS